MLNTFKHVDLIELRKINELSSSLVVYAASIVRYLATQRRLQVTKYILSHV